MDEGDDPKYAPIGGSEKIGGGAKMKYIALRPFADPEAAACKLMEIIGWRQSAAGKALRCHVG